MILAQKTSYAPFFPPSFAPSVRAIANGDFCRTQVWQWLVPVRLLIRTSTRLWQIFGRSEDDMEMSGYPKWGRCESGACRAYSAVPVLLTVAPTQGVEIELRGGGGGGGGGTTNVWLPPTAAENERASRVGQRGEELVYRMELQKVRDMGYAKPELYVVWTSQDDPGADHDIRSIDINGEPRWIEVKSTTGVDGRFDWPRREFEKALRERERYELWRVYRVAAKEILKKTS